MEYQPGEARKYRLEWCQLYVGVLTLVVVAIYTSLAYKQWYEMREAVEISRKALDANERAWLIEDVTSFFLADVKRLPAFIVHTKNAGKSPAWGIRHVVACRFDSARPSFIPDPYPNELTIAPGEKRERTLKCWSTSTQDAAEMAKGREFWLWILTLYNDPFAVGKDRKSLECWHRPKGSGQSFESCQVGANIYE